MLLKLKSDATAFYFCGKHISLQISKIESWQNQQYLIQSFLISLLLSCWQPSSTFVSHPFLHVVWSNCCFGITKCLPFPCYSVVEICLWWFWPKLHALVDCIWQRFDHNSVQPFWKLYEKSKPASIKLHIVACLTWIALLLRQITLMQRGF